jgi:hypothetical protein
LSPAPLLGLGIWFAASLRFEPRLESADADP